MSIKFRQTSDFMQSFQFSDNVGGKSVMKKKGGLWGLPTSKKKKRNEK